MKTEHKKGVTFTTLWYHTVPDGLPFVTVTPEKTFYTVTPFYLVLNGCQFLNQILTYRIVDYMTFMCLSHKYECLCYICDHDFLINMNVYAIFVTMGDIAF